jgi:hypothetical protein
MGRQISPQRDLKRLAGLVRRGHDGAGQLYQVARSFVARTAFTPRTARLRDYPNTGII